VPAVYDSTAAARHKKRRELIGETRVREQDEEAVGNSLTDYLSRTPKKDTIRTIKRVEEYKAAEKERNASEARMEKLRKELEATRGKEVGFTLPSHELDSLVANEDPMFTHLQGTVPASPEEEGQLVEVIAGAGEALYKAEVFPKVIRALSSHGDFYEGASTAALHILRREEGRIKEDGRKPEPAVFFAETGAIPFVVDQLFQIGRKAGIAGSESPDQYAATVVNLYRLMGEELVKNGDEDAIREAEELAMDMALTKEDGTSYEEAAIADQAKLSRAGHNQLAQGISNALLT
jgi:hypothetical protein